MKSKAADESAASAAQEAALSDWLAGNISNEFYDKTADRGISGSDLERVLKSNSSGVWRYRHEKGQPRYGFWHPESFVFVAWQPKEQGLLQQIKTCFRRVDISSYIANLDEVTCLREPKW